MNIKRTGTAVLGALLLGFLPTVAGATPGSGVTATLLGKGTSDGSITLKAKGRTDVVFREITIAPGGTTGWHYHPGQVLAVVKSGTLTRKLDDCATEVTPAAASWWSLPGTSTPTSATTTAPSRWSCWSPTWSRRAAPLGRHAGPQLRLTQGRSA
ncbi:cupin domain-containing protein [Kitasatospora gansuensis]